MKWEKVKLGEVLIYEQPTRYIVDSEDYDDTYPTPVLTAGKTFILGYTDETNGIYTNLPAIIFDDFTTESKFVTFPFKVKSSAMKILTCDAHVADIRYMFYLLKNLKVLTDQHKRYWISKFANIEIPLPPLHIQEQIADTLDKADALRRKDHKLLQKYYELAQSIFYDMFGDPVRNERGWEVKKLGELTSHVSSGSTPLGGQKVYKNTGILFIRSQNVLMRSFDVSDAVFIDEETHQKMKRTWVKHNDVLLNITGASIGRIAVYEGEDNCANVNQHVCIIRPIDETVDAHYLMLTMATDIYQAKIIASSTGGTRESFTFEQIKQFVIPVPPLSLQKKYAKLVKKIKDIQLTGKHISRSSQKTFNAIMSEYFS